MTTPVVPSTPASSDLVTLEARPERRLIRPGGSSRHVLFSVRVAAAGARAASRLPLTLGIVLDRSGSMQGVKLHTAKDAAAAVLDRLDERDSVALTTFDNEVEVLQPLASVTAPLRARVRSLLGDVHARGSTALHEGWLTGCRALAGDVTPAASGAVSRCFLLTDGLANAGLTDPEEIAVQAAGIRERAGIATSTFGIGPDYDEGLLGPMAVAGGGRFSHLRTAREIASTFAGELSELFAVTASAVRLEIEAAPRITWEAVSAYWTRTGDGELPRLAIPIGDLMRGEERPVVVRFSLPAQQGDPHQVVRARVVWLAGGAEHSSSWREVAFRYATDDACDAETRDPEVMHWVGLHHADRARREATERSKRGDLAGARHALRAVAQRIGAYAGTDGALNSAVDELHQVERQVADAPPPPMVAKELIAESYRRSRGQRDTR